MRVVSMIDYGKTTVCRLGGEIMRIKRKSVYGILALSGLTFYLLPKKAIKDAPEYYNLSSIIQDEAIIRQTTMDQIMTSVTESIQKTQEDLEQQRERLLEALDEKLAEIARNTRSDKQIDEAAQVTADYMQELAQLRKRAFAKIRALLQDYDDEMIAEQEARRDEYVSALDSKIDGWKDYFIQQTLEIMSYIQNILSRDTQGELQALFQEQKTWIMETVAKIKKPTDKKYKEVFHKVQLFRNLMQGHKKACDMLEVKEGATRQNAELALLYELSDLLRFRRDITPLPQLSDLDLQRAVKTVTFIEEKESEVASIYSRLAGLTDQLAVLDQKLKETLDDKGSTDKKMQELLKALEVSQAAEKERVDLVMKIELAKRENSELEATVSATREQLAVVTNQLNQLKTQPTISPEQEAAILRYKEQIHELTKKVHEADERAKVLDEYALRLEEEVLFVMKTHVQKEPQGDVSRSSTDMKLREALELELDSRIKA